MIIKTSDFQLDSYIPNKDDAPYSDMLGNEGELQGFINIYEKEALIRTLGYDLYALLIAQFTDGGEFKANTDQKWIDLVNGVGAYRGLKPMIIGYVFWKFIESDDSHYASAHVVKQNSDTATRFESRPKAVAQYKKFYEYAVGTYYNNPTVFYKPSIFGNLKAIIFSGAGAYGSNFKSLYQYLTEKIVDFELWAPENLAVQNYFDI